jgi:hypothetical protein
MKKGEVEVEVGLVLERRHRNQLERISELVRMQNLASRQRGLLVQEQPLVAWQNVASEFGVVDSLM